MVKFLIQRPIAVLMAFTACFIIGLVTYFTLPVSLLPDIAIPQITVQVSGENSSARELENTVVAPVRRQLLQVAGLREIKSETRDGAGIIRMEFDFGVNTDLAFIEVNEKIDAAMNSLPKEAERPKAIKASATDIPVLYLNMTLKNDRPYEEADEQQFLNLCELAENVVKRRIEQLPEVAMADITGVPGRMLQIVPDQEKLSITGITIADLENALAANNVEPGSMLVRDGYYEYNIRIATLLRTPEDVENIHIRKGDRLMQLKDLCKVAVVSQKEQGLSVAGGKRAVTLAIIKQSDENMDNMKAKLKETTDYFTSLYPDIDFEVCRNQTELLDYTISNLQDNFTIGFLLIFLVAIYFLGDVRSPIVIGLSMTVSVVITFFLFYFFKVSLNVISLSGLILAVGMMIDNSIIVTENISQYREKGYSLKRACVAGTTEVITPMLSSSLTTIAVFVPLIFMSGIAGAIFMDQAFSIAAGLFVSYITGVMLLPVLYLLFYRMDIRSKSWLSKRFDNREKNDKVEHFYDKGIDWVFSHKSLSIGMTLATLPLCVFLFFYLDKERMPEIEQNELVMRIEWNENIHVDENRRRVNELMEQTDGQVKEHTAYVGMQDYILNGGSELSATEAELYFKTEEPTGIAPLQELLSKKVKEKYPLAVLTFSPPETIFEKLFVTGEADIVAQLNPENRSQAPDPAALQQLEGEIQHRTGLSTEGIAFRNQMNLVVDRERLLLYNVSYNELTRTLRTAFKENKVSTLRSYQQYLPVGIAGEERTINDILSTTLVQTQPDAKGEVDYVPVSSLVKVMPSEDLKSITAGKNGEYIPVSFFEVTDAPKLMEDIEQVIQETDGWEVDFSGSFFSNEKMIGELAIILFVSILLMYFILCAQFESFLQPLIVLVEIPIDIAFALTSLWLFGHTLNLMSAIGIIVTCGIVVNDSILKLDSINELRKAGTPLMEAIHIAGVRRLRPIIMTSLTTIMAMVPLLFSHDMGSELQKPLAIAMIGSMLLGTLVSLFIIPLIYWFIYRKHEKA
ncbi:MAG: efflux RND transporter permease subunit [Bacteroidaceae bacterium]|nr:efflux RND transporter permease subunit [Bacteroidaceae bacterium]MBQ4590095.1 efflux RND transporter permease subunit [Bacteroidaceae bacterium]